MKSCLCKKVNKKNLNEILAIEGYDNNKSLINVFT